MTFTPGRKLGGYEIVGPLGAGGMGEVYRARDSRLKREVALKVVSERFSRDAEPASRFGAEALMLASLNHPNIAAIYGLEESAGQQFFVMELVEGETLAEIILDRAPLKPAEALEICTQVAAALEAAHLKKITHRDVKPSNIKVTPEGRVKVLDFGLAKAFRETQDENLSQLSTALDLRTEPGCIVGTLAYMSPEQARGKPVDHRTDIWSFGCVLYELLSGKRSFQGETPSDTLAAILGREPDWHALPSSTPARIKDLLRRCLQKNADLRFQTMGEVLTGIEQTGRSYPKMTRRQAIAAAAVPMAGILGFAFWPNLARYWNALMLPKQKYIAVLPFQNVGGDAEQQAFCDGLTDTLTTALNRYGDLSVVPAAESRKLENAQQARREFGVNLIVSGQVRRRGENVTLTLSLTDMERPRQMDESIDWPVAKLFEIEDAVLAKLADLMNVALTSAPEAVALSRVPGAVAAYFRGRGFLYRYDRPGNLDRALFAFEEAALEDEKFALAYVGKAETYWRMFREKKDPEIRGSARAAAERALELNQDLATPHVVLGAIENDEGNYTEAIRQLQIAQKKDPRDPAAHRELGALFARLNRIPEADAVYAKSIELRPGDWLTWRFAGSHYAKTQRLDEAERHFEKVIDLTPDNPAGFQNLAGVLLKQGKQKAAEKALLKAIEINPTTTALSNLGFVYMAQQHYKDAVNVMERAATLARDENRNEYKVYGNLGDAYWLDNRMAKARQAWQQAATIVRKQIGSTGDQGELWSFLAKFEAKFGDSRSAELHIEEALKHASENPDVRYQAGLVYTLLGRNALAIEHLAAAIKLKYPKEEIEQAPELKPLREDPGYMRLIASSQLNPR